MGGGDRLATEPRRARPHLYRTRAVAASGRADPGRKLGRAGPAHTGGRVRNAAGAGTNLGSDRPPVIALEPIHPPPKDTGSDIKARLGTHEGLAASPGRSEPAGGGLTFRVTLR